MLWLQLTSGDYSLLSLHLLESRKGDKASVAKGLGLQTVQSLGLLFVCGRCTVQRLPKYKWDNRVRAK